MIRDRRRWQREAREKSRWDSKEEILNHALKVYRQAVWDLPVLTKEAREKMEKIEGEKT